MVGFTNSRPLWLITENIKSPKSSNGTIYKTLRDYIHLSSNDKDNQKIKIAYGIACGMKFAHGHHIMHRDLKPSNILLDQNFNPKIIDFGMAKILNDDEFAYTYTGTPSYMAPEVQKCLHNKTENVSRYSFPADVYSYGMILYEMATKTEPFNKLSMHQIEYELELDHRPAFSSKQKELPDSMKKLIQMCWRTNPEERPTFSEIVKMMQDDNISFDMSSDQIAISKIYQSVNLEIQNYNPENSNGNVLNVSANKEENNSVVKKHKFVSWKYLRIVIFVFALLLLISFL
ncbi:TKL family protein kinase [Histomonas meleagridis]|uniref:TKL family protein kinase n=1 Tax=Histomonas meleagridis TaxID=135588 RepID=UPI00355A61EF|nr:TKL family protein kinase [Histomonas meleagridis]KAH0807172.1 TKL family protein kinase [Histomonas meleagridis]